MYLATFRLIIYQQKAPDQISRRQNRTSPKKITNTEKNPTEIINMESGLQSKSGFLRLG